MPKLVEPNKVQVNPVYICDSCKSSHYESLDYVNKIGKILCCCGEVIELKPISNFKVKPVYVDVKKIEKKKKFIEIENEQDDFSSDEIDFADEESVENEKQESIFCNEEFFDRSVDFLVSLGYKKREACSVVERRARIFSGTPINEDSFEDFAKFLLFKK